MRLLNTFALCGIMLLTTSCRETRTDEGLIIPPYYVYEACAGFDSQCCDSYEERCIFVDRPSEQFYDSLEILCKNGTVNLDKYNEEELGYYFDKWEECGWVMNDDGNWFTYVESVKNNGNAKFYHFQRGSQEFYCTTHMCNSIQEAKAWHSRHSKMHLWTNPLSESNASHQGTSVEYVGDKDTLCIYRPKFSNIDLICGEMPSVDNADIIFCAEAAFTGALLNDFKHSNIAGDHVSSGVRYHGYPCVRNTGAFVFYNGDYKFLYNNYANELDSAVINNGMGFAQEMMIHNGARVECIREDDCINEYRALCQLDYDLVIIDSKHEITFGDFIDHLLAIGVTEALYLDMGTGWNYSWWRDQFDDVHYIHNKKIKYTTNWITFFNQGSAIM